MGKINKKGLSLIEVMLSITIITSFLILMPTYKKQSCDVIVERFSRILTQDIEYSKTYALNYFVPITIYTLSNTNKYLVNQGLKNIITRTYDSELSLNEVSVIINRFGLISSQITMNLKCEDKNYKLTISRRSGEVSYV